MMPVSLTYDDLVRLIRVSVGVALCAAVGILWLRWDELQLAPSRVLLQTALSAIGVPPLLVLAFSKLAWTRGWLAWLLGRRMVHGLWWGELRTEFLPAHAIKPMDPIQIAFVIKQTYFFLSIQSYTATQPAHSTQETLIVEPRSARAQLQYVFEMQRLTFGEDKITTGYGDLRLTAGDTRLEGHYWTNSPTRGSIWLDLVARTCDGIDSFADAQRVFEEHRNRKRLLN
jgi:SMODS-associating 2TM, beta-strand rich effector domain